MRLEASRITLSPNKVLLSLLFFFLKVMRPSISTLFPYTTLFRSLHTWSPDGHASAPTAVSMLHAGVLLKLGAYVVVRMGMGLLPEWAADLAWRVGMVACVNIVYVVLSSIAQMHLKYAIAYLSVPH